MGINSFNNFYSSATREPDMRQELINTFNGVYPEVAKAQTILIRRMRRDSNGKLLECSCVDKLTHEADKDIYCPISLTERYLWDESFVQCYKVVTGGLFDLKQRDPGLYSIHNAFFYFKYDALFDDNDKFIEIALNDDGTNKTPLERTANWRIHEIVRFHADNSKLEFIKVSCTIEDIRYLNFK